MTKHFIEASQEGGAAFLARNISGEIVMLIHQKSLSDFMAFTSNQEYLSGLGHRAAALEDSRLLPIVETMTAT